MKCSLYISNDVKEEEIKIYAREQTDKIREIIKLAEDSGNDEIIGYDGEQSIRLDINEINVFVIENRRLFAICDSGKYRIKKRLYEIEQMELAGFVKINQSSLANIKKIKRFGASFGAAMTISFASGYVDYVSRRQLKTVKKALGL